MVKLINVYDSCLKRALYVTRKCKVLQPRKLIKQPQFTRVVDFIQSDLQVLDVGTGQEQLGVEWFSHWPATNGWPTVPLMYRTVLLQKGDNTVLFPYPVNVGSTLMQGLHSTLSSGFLPGLYSKTLGLKQNKSCSCGSSRQSDNSKWSHSLNQGQLNGWLQLEPNYSQATCLKAGRSGRRGKPSFSLLQSPHKNTKGEREGGKEVKKGKSVLFLLTQV